MIAWSACHLPANYRNPRSSRREVASSARIRKRSPSLRQGMILPRRSRSSRRWLQTQKALRNVAVKFCAARGEVSLDLIWKAGRQEWVKIWGSLENSPAPSSEHAFPKLSCLPAFQIRSLRVVFWLRLGRPGSFVVTFPRRFQARRGWPGWKKESPARRRFNPPWRWLPIAGETRFAW